MVVELVSTLEFLNSGSREKMTMFFAQEVQQVPVAAVPAPLPTLPPAPLLEPSFNFLQDSQVTFLHFDKCQINNRIESFCFKIYI